MDTSATSRRTPILRWADQLEGARVVGVFEGMREGKYGLLCDLVTDAGPLTVPAPTVLAERLAAVTPGASISIIHHGLRPSQKNPTRSYRAFEVEVREAEEEPERQAPEAEMPDESETVGAQDVPF